MARADKQDATRNLAPGDKTQETDKGLKIGKLSGSSFWKLVKRSAKPEKT